MLTLPSTINVPLRYDDDDTIRIGNTRVLLEIVIHAFRRGDTPEGIVESYATLPLDDVYAVLAYYLQNREAVDTYMRQVEESSRIIREKIEANQPESAKAVRARIRKLLNEKRS